MGFLDDVYKWNLLSYLKLFLGKPLYIATTHNGEFRPSTTITISGETKKRTEVIALPQLEGYKDPLRRRKGRFTPIQGRYTALPQYVGRVDATRNGRYAHPANEMVI
jgi:hypothetical protein